MLCVIKARFSIRLAEGLPDGLTAVLQPVFWVVFFWQTARSGGDSPHDQAGDDDGPGDPAGLGPLGVFVDVFAAAA